MFGQAENRETVYVSATEAKIWELNLVSRFELKLQKRSRICDPSSGKKYTISPEKIFSIDQKDTISHLLTDQVNQQKLPSIFPLNPTLRYRVTVKKLPQFLNKTTINLEVTAFNHLESYIKNGFDTAPVTLAELTSSLDEHIKQADAIRQRLILGIFSPTGWTREAQVYIGSQKSGFAFFHNYLIPLLIDPQEPKPTYNPNDKRVAPFVYFFKPELDEERIEGVKRVVEKTLDLEEYVSLETVVEESSQERYVVLEAFRRLEKDGHGQVKTIPYAGIIIRKKEVQNGHLR